jgi:hypothetical protein
MRRLWHKAVSGPLGSGLLIILEIRSPETLVSSHPDLAREYLGQNKSKDCFTI